jgi:hypothetical protein
MPQYGAVLEPKPRPVDHRNLPPALQHRTASQQSGVQNSRRVQSGMDFSCLGGFAPKPPEFIAFRATRGAEKRKAEPAALPLGTATGIGARVALQRCPIFRSGDLIVSQGIQVVYDVVQLGSPNISTGTYFGGRSVDTSHFGNAS